MMCVARHVLLLVVGLCFAMQSMAHPLAPSLLTIDLVSATEATIQWKESLKKGASVQLSPFFPDHCQRLQDPTITKTDTAMLYQWQVSCASSLYGSDITINGLIGTNANVLVEFGGVGGERSSILLSGQRASFVFPSTISASQVIEEYVLSGIEHLVFGWDHVLFVLGLFILLYRKVATLLWAVTAFTAGHSVTLILVSLGVIIVNEVWVEIFIALSILFLALEILNPNLRPLGFSITRYPYLLTGMFGLIHGCGFASVLAQMLSNNSSKLLPLVSFNVGIEVGQCIILAALFGVGFTIRELSKRLSLVDNLKNGHQWNKALVGYGMGIMSMYWLILRVVN